jgi:hypothetical protein
MSAIQFLRRDIAKTRFITTQRLRDNPGIFRHAFHKRYIDWQNDVTFKSAFPKEDTEDFAQECINTWSNIMYLTKPDTAVLLWPHLTGIHRTVVQKRRPAANDG